MFDTPDFCDTQETWGQTGKHSTLIIIMNMVLDKLLITVIYVLFPTLVTGHVYLWVIYNL